jgi:hypothetical protein
MAQILISKNLIIITKQGENTMKIRFGMVKNTLRAIDPDGAVWECIVCGGSYTHDSLCVGKLRKDMWKCVNGCTLKDGSGERNNNSKT